MRFVYLSKLFFVYLDFYLNLFLKISLKNKKTIELEYCLMQISSDFDKKCVSIDELRKKLVEFENENYELNQLVYQHERTIDELKAKLNHTYYYDRTTFYDEDYENYNNMFEV